MCCGVSQLRTSRSVRRRASSRCRSRPPATATAPLNAALRFVRSFVREIHPHPARLSSPPSGVGTKPVWDHRVTGRPFWPPDVAGHSVIIVVVVVWCRALKTVLCSMPRPVSVMGTSRKTQDQDQDHKFKKTNTETKTDNAKVHAYGTT